MELLTLRFSSGTDSTLGLMFLDAPPKAAQFVCYVLEDQFNEPKIPGETRIPEGRYEIKLRTEGGMHDRYGARYPWHKGMLWLQDVPDFEWIYIHVGNKDDDSDGCLLVGDSQVGNITERGQVTASVAAYTRLYDMIVTALETEQVFIEVKGFV
jgi:Family of unknown function (DUF5675)